MTSMKYWTCIFIVFFAVVLTFIGESSVLAKSNGTHHASPAVAKNQHPTCKDSDMLHSEIVTSGILDSRREHANLTFLGHVKNMEECLGLCCTNKNCELAYLRNNTRCYSSQCANSELCRIVKSEKNNSSDSKISLMVRNPSSNRAYITAYIVMALASFGAVLSGTVWIVYTFVKKYREKEAKKKESAEKLANEPQVY